VSGFTDLSERLAQCGKAGTEELTEILNNCFEKMLGTIRAHEGVVLGFAGDSVTVRFADASEATACAEGLMSGMGEMEAVRTSVGQLSIGAKIVIGRGSWREIIVGDSRKADLVLAGDLVSRIAEREETAIAGEILTVESGARVFPEPDGVPRVPPEALVVPGSGDIGGEHRAVSILFVDVRRREEGDPGFGLLQGVYLALSDTVSSRGGAIHSLDSIHPQGCRIMALFGAPLSHSDDPMRAVLCGLEMKQRLQAFPGLLVRCAAGMGYVYAGTIGDAWRRQYTVIGDAVNTTARLAGTVEPGDFVVSGDMRSSTLEQLELEELDPVRVKGKEEPLARFRPLRKLGARTFRFGFVGRERELADLQAVVEARGVALITGEAGSGKTRLLDELGTRLRKAGYSVLRGSSAELGPAYPLLGSMVASAAGMDPADAPSVRREKLSSCIEGLGGPGDGLRRREVFLGRMLFSLDYPPSIYDNLTPALRADNLLEAVVLFVNAQAKPVALLLEDLHLSKPGEIEAITRATRKLLLRSGGSGVSVVASRRPHTGGVEPFEGLDAAGLTLGGLGQEAAEALLAEILSGKPLHPDVAGLVEEKAGGNPFYLVQFMLYLIEKGLIGEQGGQWVGSGSFSDEALPENVFSMIMARIDRLEERARESLKVASVIGAEFTEEVVRSVLHREVRGDLDQSAVAGLTYLSSLSELEYIFSHLLIKDVAYDSILRRRRKALHGDVAGVLEARADEAGADISPVLAYHYREAENWPKALDYAIRSGRKAKEEYRNEEAIGIFSSAASMIERHLPDRIEEMHACYSNLGSLQDTIGDYDSAIASYERSLEFASDPVERAVALESIAGMHFTRGDLDGAESLMVEIEGLLRDGDPAHDAVRARIGDFRAWSYGVRGMLDRAMPEAEKALSIAQALPTGERKNRRVLGHAYNTMATVHYAASDYQRALEYYHRALEIARELDSPREVAVTQGNIGLVYNCMGRLRESVLAIERQMQISQELGDRLIVASSHGELGSAYKPLGEIEKALSHAKSYLAISEELESAHDVLIANGYLGGIYVDTGELDRAREHAEVALELSRGSGFEREMRTALYVLGKVSYREGDLDRAVELLEQAVEVCRKLNDREIFPEILWWLGETEIDRGNLERAAACLDESMAISLETGSKVTQAETGTGLGRLYAARGETDRAVEALERSMAICEETGMRLCLASACRRLGEVLEALDGQEQRARELLRRSELLRREMGLP
ncbi:tetratricopeptide repeat protein, partial [Candidatus Fermentibacterales bacterium]|nr:tetratricopeptide repeat protein [Candidatus Fermentibacterales bacterium]